MKKVDIAIVVVTFNRPNSLERLLKSLYYSDYTGYSDIILYISIDFSDNSECQKIAESFDWIHGDKISDVFRTIKYGVPDKGMISWEKQLTPKQMADVSNYIKSLKDTHPANPKAPQGNKES